APSEDTCMLRSLVHASLKHRVVLLAAAAALVVIGTVSSLRAPVDVFPEFAPPLVEVQAEAPGLSSDKVEELVTMPLESVLSGSPYVTSARSKGVQGLSSVQLISARGTNVPEAGKRGAEKLRDVNLPQSVERAAMLPELSSTSRILKIGLTPKKKEKLTEN